MAASLRASSLNINRPTQKSRYGHDRKRDSRPRRPKSEYHFRSSPLPQTSWPLQQRTSSITTLHHSNHPLYAPTAQFSSTLMERTLSGSSISSDAPHEPQFRHPHTLPLSADSSAANGVEDRLKRLPTHTSKHARILRKLLDRPDSLDDLALKGILTAVDSIFFDNTLRGRVEWEWSSQSEYHTDLIGTTALRECRDGPGVETLIVLSEPILLDPMYDRRLLLSTFLHELIHCFLFIKCGSVDRIERGHTDGFHRIAKCIDAWVGEGELRLCSMRANLSYFRKPDVVENEFEYDYGYDHEVLPLPRVVAAMRFENWNDDDCVKEAHRHEGCNQSPLHVNLYSQDVEGRDDGYEYEYDNGYDSGYVGSYHGYVQ